MDEDFILDNNVHFVDNVKDFRKKGNKYNFANAETSKALRAVVYLIFTFYAFDKMMGNHFWSMVKRSMHELPGEFHIPHF